MKTQDRERLKLIRDIRRMVLHASSQSHIAYKIKRTRAVEMGLLPVGGKIKPTNYVSNDYVRANLIKDIRALLDDAVIRSAKVANEI